METKNKIPLRQFYKNIDEYIINQASDMALTYSLYLLNKYPKNIFVYQLLGKVLLDKQEYDKARLIFEKILEMDPDDFLSHVGISLISQNFGNVEQALSSMKRAYELQPSNESLQKEVKRLTEDKDGFAPEKIHLTRGALIKMYARSKLTEQAIAEAQLGLHESPDRIDYKVQLADMLRVAGRTEESIEKCLEILHTNPYCKPVLEILYHNFISSENEEEANQYKNRITELDPYFAFMKPETESVNNIPDIAIMEETELQDTAIDDLTSFLHETWSVIKNEDLAVTIENTENWEEIIKEAAENDGVGSPINENDYDVISLHEQDDSFDESINSQEKQPSKLDKFKSRLQSSQLKSEFDDQDEIPDWILDDPKIVDDNFAIRKSTNDTNQFEEDGMTDHLIPVNPAIESDQFMENVSDWEPEANKNTIQLDDTQRIKIVKTDPEEIKAQIVEALHENDARFAYLCVDAMISKDLADDDLALILEKYLADNPQNIELWLELVQIYHKLNETEKAITALEKAQTNITI